VAKAGYTAATSADVNVSTVKSVLGVKAHANFGLDLQSVEISFQGVVATGEPGLVELIYATFATNSPGTNSTTETPAQVYGRVITAGFTAARNWTAEPTALTVLKTWFVHPQTGLVLPLPLGRTYDCALSEGWVLRCTFATAVDLRAVMEVERC